MSLRAAFASALAGMALVFAPRIHAGVDGRSSSLIPVWDWEGIPRNFILDSSRLDSRILDTIAERLGAKAVSHGETGFYYERRRFGRTVYDYWFRAEWTPATLDTLVVDTNAWSVDTIRLRKGRLFGHYSFETWRHSTPREKNLCLFLHSAYHQELYPGYRERDSLFMPMPSQSQVGLWLRGVVSPIWAIHYARKADPFTGATRREVLENAYLLDGGFATLALFGAALVLFDGNAANRAQGLLYLGGIHTAISLGIFLPILSIDLGESMRFRASGYRFPRTLRNDPD